MIAHGRPIYVALEPVDMRWGYERLGGILRERMQAEPRSRVFRGMIVIDKGKAAIGVGDVDPENGTLARQSYDPGRYWLDRLSPPPSVGGHQQRALAGPVQSGGG